jgi:hypothetical protein
MYGNHYDTTHYRVAFFLPLSIEVTLKVSYPIIENMPNCQKKKKPLVFIESTKLHHFQ